MKKCFPSRPSLATVISHSRFAVNSKSLLDILNNVLYMGRLYRMSLGRLFAMFPFQEWGDNSEVRCLARREWLGNTDSI